MGPTNKAILFGFIVWALAVIIDPILFNGHTALGYLLMNTEVLAAYLIGGIIFTRALKAELKLIE